MKKSCIPAIQYNRNASKLIKNEVVKIETLIPVKLNPNAYRRIRSYKDVINL